VLHINTYHWLQSTTGTQDGSTKMAVCNMHISTGTEVSTYDEETYKSMHELKEYGTKSY
jgi:hypothetical protein